eukprot:CFRG6051T1
MSYGLSSFRGMGLGGGGRRGGYGYDDDDDRTGYSTLATDEDDMGAFAPRKEAEALDRYDRDSGRRPNRYDRHDDDSGDRDRGYNSRDRRDCPSPPNRGGGGGAYKDGGDDDYYGGYESKPRKSSYGNDYGGDRGSARRDVFDDDREDSYGVRGGGGYDGGPKLHWKVYRAKARESWNTTGVSGLEYSVVKRPEEKVTVDFEWDGFYVISDGGREYFFDYGKIKTINHKRGEDNFLNIVMNDQKMITFCTPDTVELKEVILVKVKETKGVKIKSYRNDRGENRTYNSSSGGGGRRGGRYSDDDEDDYGYSYGGSGSKYKSSSRSAGGVGRASERDSDYW